MAALESTKFIYKFAHIQMEPVINKIRVCVCVRLSHTYKLGNMQNKCRIRNCTTKSQNENCLSLFLFQFQRPAKKKSRTWKNVKGLLNLVAILPVPIINSQHSINVAA